ncbi:hypothetical protein BGW38_009483 [Lunasporangiospora selenospora]|uniref:FAD-binding domain-containing protein n=1 Tax=Lunasporangiospora selenospora TaxID=979761 RepID=A0A9P6G2M4_9FUNG|nr:hypothetical protein BGW38_009483 [Lunasporangiospora selenospora]
MPPSHDFKVLIVGGGLGGLMLAVLLERAGINYTIFERSVEVKPLGSALSLGANVFPVFAQLGLLDDFYSKAKPFAQTRAYRETDEKVRVRDYSPANEIAGYLPHIIARPDLYNILRKQIPPHKILLSKKVLSIHEREDGEEGRRGHVRITCSDKSIYEGDVLVGADGAYSAVRQGLYKKLAAMDLLPENDRTDEETGSTQQLPFSSICLVGQTSPQSHEKFKVLEETFSRFDITVGHDKPYSWVTFTTKRNTLCWMVIQHLDKVSFQDHDSFRNSEWGPEAAQAMCDQVKDFPLPSYPGLTIGDLMKETPKELISKVMLEEKLFETWYSGRVVLLGDACHKLHPAAGLGAVSAIHDAVALANVLYDLPSPTDCNDLTKAFEIYRQERYPIAKVSWDTSHKMSRVLGKTFVNLVIRFMINRMPDWIWIKALTRMYGYRPQVSFLPRSRDRGAVPPAPQLSLKSYENIAL